MEVAIRTTVQSVYYLLVLMNYLRLIVISFQILKFQSLVGSNVEMIDPPVKNALSL